MAETLGKYTPQASWLDGYLAEGVAFPFQAISPSEAADLRATLEQLERRDDAVFSWHRDIRANPHLLFPVFDDLVRHPRLLDLASTVLGPDLLVWSCDFFIKEAESPNRVSWHQDLHYWGLDSDDEVTVWLALSPATHESGCMRMVPGSHLSGSVAHSDTFAEDNMLTRGQELAVEVEESEAVDIELAPGQVSLHHGRIFHASGPNRSTDRRIGLAVRYLRAGARQQFIEGDFATLVQGSDPSGHFLLTEPPAEALTAEAVARYRELEDRRDRVLYRNVEDKAPKRAARPLR